MRMSMKPPPPRLPAPGCTTASAKPVATAASTALPPDRMISTPTWDANSCALTTMPCWARTGSVDAHKGAVVVTTTANVAMTSQINDLRTDRIRVGGTVGLKLLRLAEGVERSQIREEIGGVLNRVLLEIHRSNDHECIPDSDFGGREVGATAEVYPVAQARFVGRNFSAR